MTISANGSAPSSTTRVPVTLEVLEAENEELQCEAGEAIHAAEHMADMAEQAQKRLALVREAFGPFEQMARLLVHFRTEATDDECIRRTPNGRLDSHALTMGDCRRLVAVLDELNKPAPAESP